MPTILGVNFYWGLESWKNKAEKIRTKIRHQNSLRSSPAIFLRFAGPTLCRASGSTTVPEKFKREFANFGLVLVMSITMLVGRLIFLPLPVLVINFPEIITSTGAKFW